jgi:hypothetical protein
VRLGDALIPGRRNAQLPAKRDRVWREARRACGIGMAFATAVRFTHGSSAMILDEMLHCSDY